MALTYNQVSALTHRLIDGSLADAIYGSNPTFMAIRDKHSIRVRGGRKINLPIIYAKNTAVQAFQGYEVFDVTPADNITGAEADWVQYEATMSIDNRSLLLNGGGEVQAMDLLQAKLDEVKQSLEDKLGTDLFSTAADVLTGINGLRGMVKASGTLHGIATADFSGWVSDADNVTSALSYSKMNRAVLDATVGGDAPDMAVCSKGIFAKYGSVLQNVQRFGEGEKARGGFKYLLFNELPIFFDSHCPGSDSSSTADGHLFFLNSKYLFFYVHEDCNFKSIDIPPLYTQSVKATRIELMCNFMTNNRRMHSVMTKLKS